MANSKNMKKMKKTVVLISTLFLFINTPSLVIAQGVENWVMPRTADGHPDLQGVWANNTITPVERPDVYEGREFLTAEEQQFLARRVVEIQEEDGDALFGGGVFQAAVSGEVRSYDPSTGNYDQAWLVEREVHNRTSQIIDPPNGKFPPKTESALAAERERFSQRNQSPGSWLDLSTDDRCLSYGAPYLNPGYNSYWQIVQSRDHIVIYQEMIHDARIVRLGDKPPLDESIRLMNGDSRGYWDGDTLVVETRNFTDKNSHEHNRSEFNIERFTRINANQIRYQITVHQPDVYTAPYTRELVLDASADSIYEYACHEGNYSMANILRGAREQERRERSQ